ncbi:iron chelate uptake ABC transporter family permease subunit [Salinispora arenicola]|uniref:iron chelate uptake ABC transporter family permease subunit n=1 Tax=Salinispora arenicola TaxID=168697 RepID=UPI00049088D1|nr:iron chelate uptake ABC transporter family permease subunit [Salinispora arenicola]MCN0180870.1 iron chelate uptake ABC transporter family permease subunit [Salinispora arenicola]
MPTDTLSRAVPGEASHIRRHRVRLRILALTGLAVLLVTAYLFTDVTGSWEYVVQLRTRKLAAMLLVAVAVATATVLFQTVTENRILTPAIMGLDALYLLIQTMVVYLFGASALAVTDPVLRWTVEIVVMVLFATALFRWIFTGVGRSIHLLVLVGVLFGVFFRSVTHLLQRMIDPAEFAVLQDAFFASFSVEERLLGLSAVTITLAAAALLLIGRQLDVLVLGRAHAIGLGVHHRQLVAIVFALVSVLVAVSTALVGPITFLGLIVANLAYHLIGSHRHRHTIPAAILLAVIFLVGGHLLLERVFDLGTVLAVVIDFVGGIFFIILVTRKGTR